MVVRNQQPRRHELLQEQATLSEGANDREGFGSRGQQTVHGKHLARMKAKVSIRYDAGGEVVADRRFGTDGSSGGATRVQEARQMGALYGREYTYSKER